MRLWHKDLINVLPQKQLISQWRELNAIIKRIDKAGSPQHPLVNPVMNYPFVHFVCYADCVLRELSNRGYNVKTKTYTRFSMLCQSNMNKFNNKLYIKAITTRNDIYYNWHNDRYFKQCYYNLQEKYDRGMINDMEWKKIEGLIL